MKSHYYIEKYREFARVRFLKFSTKKAKKGNSMQGMTVSNFTETIFNFFEKDVFEHGNQSKFVQRDSKLTSVSFFRAIIAVCLSGTQVTLEAICGVLASHSIDITRQGLHSRMNDRAVDFFKGLFQVALSKLSHKTSQFSLIERCFSHIYLIDSTTISLPSSLKEVYKGSGGSASDAAIKLQVLFDYVQGQVNKITMTHGRDNDQGFTSYFNEISKKALYLMDLGYFKLDSFKKIIEGNAYFISRYLLGTKLYTSEGEVIHLIQTLQTAGSFYSGHVLLGSSARIAVRLIAYRLPDDVLKERIRKLKRDYRRRGLTPGKNKLALLAWNLFITNTIQEQLSDKQIYETYALRWQIELFFKMTKSGIGLDKMNTKKSSRALTELFGKLISVVIILFFCTQAQLQSNQTISLFKACKRFYSRAFEFVSSLVDRNSFATFTTNILHVFKTNAKKETKNRKDMLAWWENCF